MARSITTRSTNPKIMDDNIKILDDAIDELDGNIKDLTDYIIVNGEKAYSIEASGTFNFNPTADITIPDGYMGIGIVGFTTNSAQVLPINVTWTNSSWGVGFRNISTGAQSGTIILNVLCIKTRS